MRSMAPHENENIKAKSKQQKANSKKQPAKGKKQTANSKQQPAKSTKNKKIQKMAQLAVAAGSWKKTN